MLCTCFRFRFCMTNTSMNRQRPHDHQFLTLLSQKFDTDADREDYFDEFQKILQSYDNGQITSDELQVEGIKILAYHEEMREPFIDYLNTFSHSHNEKEAEAVHENDEAATSGGKRRRPKLSQTLEYKAVAFVDELEEKLTDADFEKYSNIIQTYESRQKTAESVRQYRESIMLLIKHDSSLVDSFSRIFN